MTLKAWSLPGGRDGGTGCGLEHVDLSLEVSVGHGGHRHGVLRPPHHHHGLRPHAEVSALHGAALLEPPVPHLDGSDVVSAIRWQL